MTVFVDRAFGNKMLLTFARFFAGRSLEAPSVNLDPKHWVSTRRVGIRMWFEPSL